MRAGEHQNCNKKKKMTGEICLYKLLIIGGAVRRTPQVSRSRFRFSFTVIQLYKHAVQSFLWNRVIAYLRWSWLFDSPAEDSISAMFMGLFPSAAISFTFLLFLFFFPRVCLRVLVILKVLTIWCSFFFFFCHEPWINMKIGSLMFNLLTISNPFRSSLCLVSMSLKSLVYQI